MPELPEVETLRRALLPLAKNRVLLAVRFFRADLRYPIPRRALKTHMVGCAVRDIVRRGKYLLLEVESGAMLWHLGMSGRVIRRDSAIPVEPHTHAVFHFDSDVFLHFIDPRRFGCILWLQDPSRHPLLKNMGLEPFSGETTAVALHEKSRCARTAIKSFLMDSRKLVGVGNIYACESLFQTGIRPTRPAGKVSLSDWERLLGAVRMILEKSIASGGTTLKDFFSTDGSAGYFSVDLAVYGKEGRPCPRCATPIARTIQTGRSTFFCKICQKR
jgi:formamidopyrimidine-DNA glycosylase